MHGHKIFIKVSINDSKAFDFIFDTGAITVIDEMVAKEMSITHGMEIPAMKSMSKTHISKDKLSFLIGDFNINDFIITIDYPNNEVIFWPVTNLINLTRYFTGFSIKEEDEKVIIKGVWENSPADKAGVMVGDELIQLNEYDVEKSSIIKLKSILDNDNIMEVTLVLIRQDIEQSIKLHKENLNTMLQLH